jgi:hypothetical protein
VPKLLTNTSTISIFVEYQGFEPYLRNYIH